MTTSFINETTVDQELQLEELSAIHGGGPFWDWLKGKAEDVGDYIEEKLGDGDDKHEWKDDYRDDAIKVAIWILKKVKDKTS